MNDVTDRGMVKYSPYKSLTAQAEALGKMRKAKGRKEKPILSRDQVEDIDRCLSNYHGQEVCITYWVDGDIKKAMGHIRKIDAYSKKIYLGPIGISFASLVSIE